MSNTVEYCLENVPLSEWLAQRDIWQPYCSQHFLCTDCTLDAEGLPAPCSGFCLFLSSLRRTELFCPDTCRTSVANWTSPYLSASAGEWLLLIWCWGRHPAQSSVSISPQEDFCWHFSFYRFKLEINKDAQTVWSWLDSINQLLPYQFLS